MTNGVKLITYFNSALKFY